VPLFAILQGLVAKLFKQFFLQQHTLGIELVEIKHHVDLSPVDHQELQVYCTSDIVGALERAGWWRRDSSPTAAHILGTDMLTAADGRSRMTESVMLELQIIPPCSVVLLMKVCTGRFRHPFVPGGNETETMEDVGAGRFCCVLPTLTAGIVHDVRKASDKEIAWLQDAWAAKGFPLSSTAFQRVIDIRFVDDDDSLSFPFPACAVLSSLGLDEGPARLQAVEVQAAVLRLQGKPRASSVFFFSFCFSVFLASLPHSND